MVAASLVIASRNGAARLRRNLPALPLGSMARHGVEILLVDSASEDDTHDTMLRFAATAPVPVTTLRSNVKGLALAQNTAIEQSRGAVICFTDDDCQLDGNYFDKLFDERKRDTFHYGTGEIIIRGHGLDRRMANTANWTHEGNRIIPEHSLIGPGVIQGANMFFERRVLTSIGGVHAIGDVANNDILTGYLASRAGHRGVQMRGLKVYHDHERRTGSPEAQETVQAYARSSGAFYARLLALGEKRTLTLWHLSRQNKGQFDLKAMQIEFEAAAEELRRINECGGAGAEP